MLDPNRFALNAETVGFRRRMKQPVNMDAFSRALQTETDTIKVRRELQETPISEVHTMGGQLYGFSGNAKTNEMARQQRQINGYPLREFQQGAGPIVLPVKRAESSLALPMNVGLVQYTQYNAVVGDYVSRMVEPNPDHIFGTVQDGTEHNVTMSQAYELRRENVRNWQESKSRETQNWMARKSARSERNPGPYGPDLHDLHDIRVAQTNLLGQIRGLAQGDNLLGGATQSSSTQPESINAELVKKRREDAAAIIRRAIGSRIVGPKKPTGQGTTMTNEPKLQEKSRYINDTYVINNSDDIAAHERLMVESQIRSPAADRNLAYGSSPSPGQLQIAATPGGPVPAATSYRRQAMSISNALMVTPGGSTATTSSSPGLVGKLRNLVSPQKTGSVAPEESLLQSAMGNTSRVSRIPPPSKRK